MASNEYINPQTLVAKVKMLINAQLKEILKREGLAVSGLKSVLQERIISRKSRFVGDWPSDLLSSIFHLVALVLRVACCVFISY